jgi:hypothetical protein
MTCPHPTTPHSSLSHAPCDIWVDLWWRYMKHVMHPCTLKFERVRAEHAVNMLTHLHDICICIHVYMYVYMYTCIHTCIHTYVFTYVCAYIYNIYIHTCIYICVMRTCRCPAARLCVGLPSMPCGSDCAPATGSGTEGTRAPRVALECCAWPHQQETLHVQSVSRWAPSNIGPYSQATDIKSSHKHVP